VRRSGRRRRIGGHGGLDRGQILGDEGDLEGAQRLGETVAAPGTHQRHDVAAPREHPRDGQLRDGDAPGLGDPAQRLDQGQVAPQVLTGEPGQGRAEIRLTRPHRAPMTRDQAAGQHTISGDTHAELTGGRQQRVLDAAGDQRVLDLHVTDRVHRNGSAQRLRPDLGQPDVPHVSGLDQLRHRPDGLLDRHRRIHTGRAIDVNMVGAQPLERVGQEVLHRDRPAVQPDDRTGRVTHDPELHADDRPVTVAAPQRLTQQQLVAALAVPVAGIQQGHPGVQRGVDGGDALGLIRRAIQIRHAHQAKAQGRDGRTGGTQASNVHERLPLSDVDDTGDVTGSR
jgi:hypothetical protein